jgi:hypothetical protein
MDFVYTVWFRDTSAQPDDQDYELLACIVIEADSIEVATAMVEDTTIRMHATAYSRASTESLE